MGSFTFVLAAFILPTAVLAAVTNVDAAQDDDSQFPGQYTNRFYAPSAAARGISLASSGNDNAGGGAAGSVAQSDLYGRALGSTNGQAVGLYPSSASVANSAGSANQYPYERTLRNFNGELSQPVSAVNAPVDWNRGYPSRLQWRRRREAANMAMTFGELSDMPSNVSVQVPVVDASNISFQVLPVSGFSELRQRRAVNETVIPIERVNDTTSRVLVLSTGNFALVPTNSQTNLSVAVPATVTNSEIKSAQVGADELSQQPRLRRFSGYGMNGGNGFPAFGQSAGTAIGTANALQGFSSSSGDTFSHGGMSRSLAQGQASGFQPSSTSIANSQSSSYMRRRRDSSDDSSSDDLTQQDDQQQADSAGTLDPPTAVDDEDFSQPQQTDDYRSEWRRKREVFLQVLQSGPGNNQSASGAVFNVTLPAGPGFMAVASSGSASSK